MKFLVVLSVVVACVAADVSHIDAAAPIVKFENTVNPDNSYTYSYETGNGIYAAEQGLLKNAGENPSIEATGSYGYKTPEGVFEVSYVANENGFQPKGAHLPVAPEIPEYILRSLEYIRTHAPQEKRV